MSKNKNVHPTSVRPPQELAERIDYWAGRDNRKTSNMMIQLLTEACDARDKQEGTK